MSFCFGLHQDANVVNGNNFSQLFTTKVFGGGHCVSHKALMTYAPSSKHDPAQGSEIGKMFMFSAKPVIYSNDEQTLSFLVDVQFQAPQIPGKQSKCFGCSKRSLLTLLLIQNRHQRLRDRLHV